MPIEWLTAFLDFPPATFGPASAYWQAVTGYQLSAPRGPAAEFATLLPGEGSAFVRVQRTGGGSPGCHLDVHTPDVRTLTDRALRLGAQPTDQDPVPAWPYSAPPAASRSVSPARTILPNARTRDGGPQASAACWTRCASTCPPAR
jgi:glyoxalase superfamily protein